MPETINLIPKSERIEQTKTKVVKFSTILSILILIVALGLGGYFFYQTYTIKQQIKELDAKVVVHRAEISKLSNIEIHARNLFKKSNTLNELFKSKFYYSRMLTELERSTPAGVIVDSFTISTDKKLNLSGIADNYNLIQDFSNKLLQTKLFTEVALNTVSLENRENKVNYFIVVNFDSSMLNEQ